MTLFVSVMLLMYVLTDVSEALSGLHQLPHSDTAVQKLPATPSKLVAFVFVFTALKTS